MDDLPNSDTFPKNIPSTTGDQGTLKIGMEHNSIVSAAQLAVRDVTRLTRVLSILNEPLPLNARLEKVLSALSELFFAEVTVLLDPIGSGTYLPLAALGLPEKRLKTGFSHEKGNPLTRVMETGKPVRIDDLDTEPDIDISLRGLGIRSCLWLPVLSYETVRGALIMARCQLAPFDNVEIGQLLALSQRIGLALEQSSRNQQIMEILENGRITHDLKEPSIVALVVERFLQLTGADATAIFLLNDDGHLYCASRLNIQPERGFVYAKVFEVMVSVDEISKAIIFTQDQMSKIVTQIGLDFSTGPLPAVSLLVPLLRDDNVIGVLAAFRSVVDAYPPEVLPTATLFANQTSAAIDNARLFKTLKDELVEREELTSELKVSDDRFRALIRNVNDVIIIMTGKGRFIFVSPAAKTAWGVDAESLAGKRMMDRVHSEDTLKIRDVIANFVHDGDEGHLRSIRMRYGDNEWKDFEVTLINMVTDPVIGGVVGTFHDVTERHVYEHRLHDMAYHDPLTGLPNRKFFEENLNHAIESARLSGLLTVVVYMDLDGFKLINDSLGHHWGDSLLHEVADRLQKHLRRGDSAARMGGDEFTILLEGVSSREQVGPIIQRFIDALKEPVRLDDRDMYISASFGAVIGSGTDNSVDLLRKADMAMYQAKNRGKGGYVIFDEDIQQEGLDEEASDQMILQSELQRALSCGEFMAAFTPIYSLDGLKEMALEAQLNWMHPRHGRLVLTDFLPVAYKSGIMAKAGQWLSEEAVRQVGLWNSHKQVPLYLRFPARFVTHVDFASWIARLTADARLKPALMTLDIIADDTVSQPDVLISRMRSLKEIGFRLTVSDFGINFASMKALPQFPIDYLRMDVSHLRELGEAPVRALLEGTLRAARAFGIDVILEGIESPAQVELARSFGYAVGMGGGLSGPLLADEVERRHLFGL